MLYLRTLLEVLKKPAYASIAVLVTFLTLSFAVWLPNLKLIVLVFKTASIYDFLSFIFSLYGAIGTNFTAFSASYTIVIAVLFGINVALLSFYIRKVKGSLKGMRTNSMAGIGGLISGVLGIGCAACGTFILTSFLTIFGAGSLLAFLPLGGEEFGLIGIALLVFSIYQLLKKIESPLVCLVK